MGDAWETPFRLSQNAVSRRLTGHIKLRPSRCSQRATGERDEVHQMHVSVTALGASAGKRGRAAGQVIGYLHGGAEAEHGGVEPRRSAPGSSPTPTPSLGVGSYFADSSESAK